MSVTNTGANQILHADTDKDVVDEDNNERERDMLLAFLAEANDGYLDVTWLSLPIDRLRAIAGRAFSNYSFSSASSSNYYREYGDQTWWNKTMNTNMPLANAYMVLDDLNGFADPTAAFLRDRNNKAQDLQELGTFITLIGLALTPVGWFSGAAAGAATVTGVASGAATIAGLSLEIDDGSDLPLDSILALFALYSIASPIISNAIVNASPSGAQSIAKVGSDLVGMTAGGISSTLPSDYERHNYERHAELNTDEASSVSRETWFEHNFALAERAEILRMQAETSRILAQMNIITMGRYF